MDLRLPTESHELPDSNLSSLDKLSPTSSCLCEECDQAPAKYRCTECEQNLCLSCEKRIHNKGARKNHQRTAIAVQVSTTQESKVSDVMKSKQPSLTSPLTDNSSSAYNNTAFYYPNQPLKLPPQCNI
jgi:hypothetical protein